MKRIRKVVHTLRSHSVKTRRAILLGVSFGVTGFIFLIWIASFAFGHKDPTLPLSKEKQAESPFAIIKDSVIEMKGDSSVPTDSEAN